VIEFPTPARPSAISEVRAWLTVGIVIVVHLIGGVWWAATLSNQILYIREAITELKDQTKKHQSENYTAEDAQRDIKQRDAVDSDHETRLRKLETPWTKK
jgi:hypothetical protein